MVIFVFDMLLSIVRVAWSCNELRDFVAFAAFGLRRRPPFLGISFLYLMSGSRTFVLGGCISLFSCYMRD